MQDDAFVIVFPSEFAKPKMSQLIKNIKKELQIKEQKFQSVKREDDIIIVQANDPVFASSAINQLFGIKKIAIARQTKNDQKTIIEEITRLGGNLLLKGEKFLIQIQGAAKGFVPKDVEMAATSSIIEKKSELGVTPGSENRYDKLLYTYITKKSAYICIFVDKGHDGVPNLSQNQKIICPIYDELSAISCIETTRQGFEVKIIIAFRKKSELSKIAKMLTRVITYTLESEISLEFYHFDPKISSQYDFINSIIQLSKIVAKRSKIQRIALPLSNQIFPIEYIDSITKFINNAAMTPHFVMQGLEDNIRDMAKEFVLEKHFGKIRIYREPGFSSIEQTQFSDNALYASKNKQTITVKIGPNNLHDILDSIE